MTKNNKNKANISMNQFKQTKKKAQSARKHDKVKSQLAFVPLLNAIG